MVNKIRVREEEEAMLAAKSSQQVDKILKGEMNQMAKATKTKATHANKPTAEKFLSAKDIAKMAKVKPTVLRRCLRKSFAGRISTAKNGAGLKVYQVKANDPIVKEILAKLKGNGRKPATPVKTKAEKPASSPVKGKVSGKGKKQAKVGKPTPEAVFQSTADKQEAETPTSPGLICNLTCKYWQDDGTCSKRGQRAEAGITCELYEQKPPMTLRSNEAEFPTENDKGEGDEPSPESCTLYEGEDHSAIDKSPSRIEDFDPIYGGKDSRKRMEKIVAQAHSEAK